MIIKIKSHKRPTFGKLLKYMIENKDRLFDSDGKSFVITHNLKGNSITNWEKQFKENENYRLRKRKDSVYLTHEILSWHKQDSEELTLLKLEEMAHEYIRTRNPKGMYMAVPHFDKGHFHIHVCASGIEYRTGKSLRLPKAELQKLKQEIQQYQIKRFPELSHSLVSHGGKIKSRLTDKDYQIKLRTGKETNKEQVIKILTNCYKKAKSKESFYKLLEVSGMETYSRKGIVAGVIHNNYKFRFKRHGLSIEDLENLDRSSNRSVQLEDTRGYRKRILRRQI